MYVLFIPLKFFATRETKTSKKFKFKFYFFEFRNKFLEHNIEEAD